MADQEKNFDLRIVNEQFKQCNDHGGEIALDPYIDAYAELCKFFNLFGTIFGFVVSDVNNKLDILREHRASEAGPNFITVQTMVNYEVSNNLARDTSSPSGSRTLLRLHRAMEFILMFLRNVLRAQEKDGLHDAAANAYDGSLGNYHPWIVRKGVALAFYSLPTKAVLLQRMGMEDQREVEHQLHAIIDCAQPVYEIIQKVYIDNCILDLP